MKRPPHPRRAKPVGNKRKYRFQLSFDLNTSKGSKVDPVSIQQLNRSVEHFISSWDGDEGYFHVCPLRPKADIIPSYLEIKRVD